jgi:spore germination protein YaaH
MPGSIQQMVADPNLPSSFISDEFVPEEKKSMQAAHKSIHQEEAEKYALYDLKTDLQWDSLRFAQSGVIKSTRTKKSRSCNLQKRVYGWHPYWSNGLQSNYDWNGLTDLCYFSYDVTPSTGAASSTHGWSTATVVTDAQANGVNVTLCATLFSGHNTFFASSTAQQTLITNLINLVQSRNAHGVNIDFEGMSSSHKVPFTNFMINLCTQMHSAIPGSEVSIAVYAVDWGGVFDMAVLDQYVDLFIIMGYDYYYSGSTTAGPEAPLYNFQTSYNYTLAKSVTYYLKQGATNSKLLLGLPWYGREWGTTLSTIPSAVSGAGTSSVTYKTMRDNTNSYYSTRQWDATSFSSYFVSNRAGSWWQAFIDDKYSLGKRFDMVNQRNIGGIGIWALGYDDGYSDLWNLIEEKFTDCAIIPCTDTIYDMGGPARNYYDAEDYTFTIAPTAAASLTLDFDAFSTELNYDTLWIYDGPATSSGLIGVYHGSTSPGTIISTGSALTLRFKSDNATVASGFSAIWTCLSDLVPPGTAITIPGPWATSNFIANFSDIDNIGGTGIASSFYQVLENNGTEWRSNNGNGFFNDDFDSAIHTDWTSATGSWSINSASLKQGDQTLSNTNIYAPLTQNLSAKYLYNWKGKISGTGINRRAGFHYFCDNASLTNRGNSYFVWFRPDQGSCEFYKVISDTFYLKHSVPLTINAGQWYDYKVIYDRITGKTEVYQDNIFAGSWIDILPLANGNAISFRSGNCEYMVNDLKVFRSRTLAETVTVGAAANNDIRYQNNSPANPGGRINSITKDIAGNISPITSQDINVDWTPAVSSFIFDGAAADVDTSYSLTQLLANWNSGSDPHSGVQKYYYSIGTGPTATDVVGWTDNGSSTSATATALSLSAGQIYYFNIHTLNGAGLLSPDVSSDGQIIMTATSVDDVEAATSMNVHPNPFTNSAQLVYELGSDANVQIILSDVLGKTITLQSLQHMQKGVYTIEVNREDLKLGQGMYFLSLYADEKKQTIKVLIR